MRTTAPLLASLLAPLCLAPALHAQSFIIPPVSFTGAPAFSSADLLAVTALKPGATATQETIQAAAQHLNDTGLFTDIRFESNSKGIVFKLTPMPAGSVLPATFANFVWWQPSELDALLKARVPLYIGLIPTAGNLQESVTSALTALVHEKGVPTAQVSAILASSPGSPQSFAFSISDPAVVIHTLSFRQASPSLQPRLSELATHQAGMPWVEPDSPAGISAGITDIYRDDGFLDARVLSITHAAPSVTAGAINVDLTATISEGEPYRISAVTWAGSDQMSVADFNKTLKLHPGDIASQSALRASLRPLVNTLSSHGYQDAKVQAPATLDRATHHVAYTVTVIPGDQYRLRSVKTVGLTASQQKEFDAAWRLHPGDPFDTIYTNSFLLKNSALKSLVGHSAKWKAVSDPDTHLVDLTLTFTKGGTLVVQP